MGFSDWVSDNSDYIIGGLETIGGAALLATGVGGAGGIGLITSGLGTIGTGIANDRLEKSSTQQENTVVPNDKSIREQLAYQRQLREQQKIASNILNQNGYINTGTVFALGGTDNPLVQYKGAKHEQGGITLPNGSEVEDGETSILNYIFSNRLKPKGSKKTFAEISKEIKQKYQLRKDDKYDKEAMIQELLKLKQAQEELKSEMFPENKNNVSENTNISENINDLTQSQEQQQQQPINIKDTKNQQLQALLDQVQQNKKLGLGGYDSSIAIGQAIPNLLGSLELYKYANDINYDRIPELNKYKQTPVLGSSYTVNPALVDNTSEINKINTIYGGINDTIRQNSSSLGEYLTNRLVSGTLQNNSISDTYLKNNKLNADYINKADELNVSLAQRGSFQNASMINNANSRNLQLELDRLKNNSLIQRTELGDIIGLKQQATNFAIQGLNNYNTTKIQQHNLLNQFLVSGSENYKFRYDSDTGRIIPIFTVDGETYEIINGTYKKINP